MMLRLHTFLCTVAPIASHLVSGVLLNQAIVERNALFKIIPPPPPKQQQQKKKTETLSTQSKMNPISYQFLLCRQAFSCYSHVFRRRDWSFVLCGFIKGLILRTNHYTGVFSQQFVAPACSQTVHEGEKFFFPFFVSH